MHCMLMDLLYGFEVLSTTEEILLRTNYDNHSINKMIWGNFGHQTKYLNRPTHKAQNVLALLPIKCLVLR